MRTALIACLIVAALLAVTVWQCTRPYVSRGFHYRSPDGQHVASFFGVGGGGAAGWADERVSVRPVDSNFDESQYVFAMEYGYEVCLRWLGPNRLVIEYPAGATVRKAEETVELRDRIHLEYESRVSAHGVFHEPGCDGRGGKLGGAHKPWDAE